MKLKDYIILSLIIVAFFFIAKCNNTNSVSEEFVKELLERETVLNDSIAVIKERMHQAQLQQVTAQAEFGKTNTAVNNYFTTPTQYTAKDTANCYHLVQEVNTCQGLLSSLQFTANKANETNLGLITQFEKLTSTQSQALENKDLQISELAPRGRVFITGTTNVGNGFTPPYLGITYVAKKRFVLEYKYDYSNIAQPNQATFGYQIFSHK